MKLFFKSKDGGPESNVTGYWLIEWKKVFSIVLLRFDKGSREAYHNHAFNAWSWIIKGELAEIYMLSNYRTGEKTKHIKFIDAGDTIFTSRDRLHKVYGLADRTWVLSFRGPWNTTWNEYFQELDKTITLTNGRKVIQP